MITFQFRTIPNFSRYVVNADGHLYRIVGTKKSL